MSRMIVVDTAKCTNCRMCELACSLTTTGAFAPSQSRIRVHAFAEEFKYIPLTCLQCAAAPCVKVCPAGALLQGEELVRFVPQACIGCRMCMLACPFGVISFDSAEGVIAKCDTCNGDPECVKFCTSRALEFRESALGDVPRGRDFARRVVEAARG
ncbi:MAG TPA: 4Fe-4S dicluster domain-containing protein [Candidatus Methylomirabilis sp.]|nr:4Fe-4S dicluster domain-containing protein [Candidatus Methylomirabilis sp.]